MIQNTGIREAYQVEGFFDIHSHIIPAVDDGAVCLDESLKLLAMMAENGVKYVAATPHFYAEKMALDEYISLTDRQFDLLKSASNGEVRLIKGFEVRYFGGISVTDSIRRLTIGGSDYILLEFPYNQPITEKAVRDIEDIYYNFGITPILAHIERYSKYRGFDTAMGLIADGMALGHINASSMFDHYRNTALGLIEAELATLMASDTHSVDKRPPLISGALEIISDEFGIQRAEKIVKNSQRLYNDIIG